jgi:sigma-B regulation protein RsbU (phosphoserine phosphatase)
MFPGAAYEVGTVRLGPGELAVLFTDGVTEGRNARSEEYTEQKLQGLIREHRELPAAELCRKVIEDVHGFSYETEPCDDMTLVVVKRSAVAA